MINRINKPSSDVDVAAETQLNVSKKFKELFQKIEDSDPSSWLANHSDWKNNSWNSSIKIPLDDGGHIIAKESSTSSYSIACCKTGFSTYSPISTSRFLEVRSDGITTDSDLTQDESESLVRLAFLKYATALQGMHNRANEAIAEIALYPGRLEWQKSDKGLSAKNGDIEFIVTRETKSLLGFSWEDYSMRCTLCDGNLEVNEVGPSHTSKKIFELVDALTR